MRCARHTLRMRKIGAAVGAFFGLALAVEFFDETGAGRLKVCGTFFGSVTSAKS